MKKFKVGDKVKDLRYGKGVVTNIDPSSEFISCSIRVQFENSYALYSLEGKHVISHKNRTLFHIDEPFKSDDESDLQNEFPKVMMVSNNGSEWIKRVVLAIIHGTAIAEIDCDNLAEYYNIAQDAHNLTHWNYFKNPDKIVELTLQDISEGKGVGVPSHLIRIKE